MIAVSVATSRGYSLTTGKTTYYSDKHVDHFKLIITTRCMALLGRSNVDVRNFICNMDVKRMTSSNRVRKVA